MKTEINKDFTLKDYVKKYGYPEVYIRNKHFIWRLTSDNHYVLRYYMPNDKYLLSTSSSLSPIDMSYDEDSLVDAPAIVFHTIGDFIGEYPQLIGTL